MFLIKKGSSLIVVIMVTVILVIMGSGLFVYANMTTSTMKKEIDNTKAYWSLESGVNYGLSRLNNLILGDITQIDEKYVLGDDSIPLFNDLVYNNNKISTYLKNTSRDGKILWNVVSEVKLENGTINRLSIKDIEISSPFKYARGMFEAVPSYNDGFRFYGPTYFGKGLMIANNNRDGKVVYPIFEGLAEVASLDKSQSFASKYDFGDPNSVWSNSPLLYTDYTGFKRLRTNWLQSSTPIDGVNLTEYNYGLFDTEADWDDTSGGYFSQASGQNAGAGNTGYWMLTNENPTQTEDRLEDAFRGGYSGRTHKLSVPNITPSFDEIKDDPRSIHLTKNNLGNHENIAIVFRTDGDKTYGLLYKRNDSYNFAGKSPENLDGFEEINWPFLGSNKKEFTANEEAVAIDKNIKNVAVFGKLAQSFSVITHSADIEIYDDIAPANVYDEYATGRIIDKFDEFTTNSDVNITKDIANTMQEKIAESNVKIALIAGLESKADLIISLANYAPEHNVSGDDFEGFNLLDPYALKEDPLMNKTYSWEAPLIIGAGLFSPHGGFGADYMNTRHTIQVISLGTILTKTGIKKINPEGEDFGITGMNNDPQAFIPGTTTPTMSGTSVTFVSDPRYTSGETPPFVRKAIEEVSLGSKINIKMKLGSGTWVYETNVYN